MKKLLFPMIFLFICNINAQVEQADKFKRPAPGYYQDFLNFDSDQPQTTRLDAFIQVPYSFMQFVKVAGGFRATYVITLSLFDKNKNQLIVEKVWTERVETADFEITNSRNSYNLSLRSFQLKPDSYVVRSEVEDNESQKRFSLETTIVVRDLSRKPALSDIMLIARQNVVEGNKKIVPNVTNNVTAQSEGIPIFFEISAREPRDIEIRYYLTDTENNPIKEERETMNLTEGKNQIFHTFDVNDLSLGDYSITVTLIGQADTEITSVKKTLFSQWAGFPSNVKDLDKAIDQLRYIAKPSEIEYIEETDTKNEKIKRYIDFWRSKDPVPSTEENEVFEEYYRRIDYANQHFSHYSEGWKTDRGMVFITLGTPSNVERHPFEYDSKPYEVWEYYDLNRSFVFVDQTGFGDYRLITPMHGDDYRYR